MSNETPDILGILDNNGIDYKLEARGREALISCPYCHHHKSKLSINTSSGFWRCLVCNETGSIGKLLNKLDIRQTPYDPPKIGNYELGFQTADIKPQEPSINELIEQINWDHPMARAYLQSRGLTHPEIYAWYHNGYIVFPLINPETLDIQALKYKSLDKNNKLPYFMKGTHPGFYIGNVHTYSEAESIIIVEGEIDAQSVHQMARESELYISAVATTGVTNRGITNYLDGFKNIYIWFDNESDPKIKLTVQQAREQLAKEIADKYPEARIFLINCDVPGVKDANDLLRLDDANKPTLAKLISEAPEYLDGKLSRPASHYVTEMVTYLTDKTKAQGMPTLIDGIDVALGGGKRLGEVTVLHAEGKTGKNTLWHQMMYMWLEAGVPIGYASRELSPESEVLPNLLSLWKEKNFWKLGNKITEIIPAITEKVNTWPLHFADGYGTFPLEDIRKWVQELKRKGVSFFWLDHFHYCMEDSENNKEIARFAKGLKSLAKEENIHLDLIVQPRFVEPGQRLSLSTLRGGSSIGQAIDNLFIMDRYKPEGSDKTLSRVKLVAARHKLAVTGTELYFEYNRETTEMNEVEVQIDHEAIQEEAPKKSWEIKG